MLTREDIDFIKQSRREIIANRTEPVVLISEKVISEDPFTGEKIVEEVRKTVDAVVTEISGEDRVLDNGIELVRGDIQFSVDYDLIAADYDSFKAVEYDSKRYVILAADRKGIGQPNRVEFSARKET